jgi:hypothetical protein
VALAAFSDDEVRLPRHAVQAGFSGAPAHLALGSRGVELAGAELVLPPWSYAWLVED